MKSVGAGTCFVIIVILSALSVNLAIGKSSNKIESKLNESGLIKNTRGKLISKFIFDDVKGHHLLFLSRDSVRNKVGTETISLFASQFVVLNGKSSQEWIIKDFQSCEGLDLSANFFDSLVAFSDLDSNQVKETTIAYQMACVGDIEPHVVKVILRQGEKKYAVRGESLIRIEGMPEEGGIFKVDSDLERLTNFKNHLLKIWKIAAGFDKP